MVGALVGMPLDDVNALTCYMPQPGTIPYEPLLALTCPAGCQHGRSTVVVNSGSSLGVALGFVQI